MIAASASEPMPYLKNFDAALAKAGASGRTVILYTGRIGLCLSNDPQKHFFDVIFKEHPRLAAQSNRFVTCERFLYVPAEDSNGAVSVELVRAMETFGPFLRRYHIRGLHPTLTFLDATAAKLNGPFSQLLACDPNFMAGTDDCYATLREYAETDEPLRRTEAQSHLRAAVLDSTNRGLALFRTRVDGHEGQKEILMAPGLPCRSQVVGEKFRFVVRECGVQRGDFSAGGYDESLIAVAGKIEGTEPFTGPILVRRNGAYFRTELLAVGTSPDHFRKFSSVSLRPGEYYFGIYVRDEKVGEELLRAFAVPPSTP